MVVDLEFLYSVVSMYIVKFCSLIDRNIEIRLELDIRSEVLIVVNRIISEYFGIVGVVVFGLWVGVVLWIGRCDIIFVYWLVYFSRIIVFIRKMNVLIFIEIFVIWNSLL